MNVSLRGKHFITLGKKDTGKSFFNNWLMSQTSDPYVCFDPLREHTDYRDEDVVIRPTETRGDPAHKQLRDVIDFARENRSTFGFVWVDEVNRFHTKGSQLDGPLGDLIDLNAHYGLGCGFIARRPSQIHTDLRELADYIFIFRLTGISDIRMLDDMRRGLGERAAGLDPREFIILHPDGSFDKHQPINATLQHSKGF